MNVITKGKAYAVVSKEGYLFIPSIATNRTESWRKTATARSPKKAWIRSGYRCVPITIEVKK